MKILAVDDEPLFLDVLKVALLQQGYEANMVTSGADALAALDSAETPFDCFLFDIQMPEMDGIELTQAVRTRAQYLRTPITMITRVSERSAIDDAFSAGATDFITKPLDRQEFATRLKLTAQLVKERQSLAKSGQKAKYRGGSNASLKLEFDTPRLFQEVGGMIDFLALENYVLTLTRSKMIGRSALAICIENIANLYHRASAGDFESMLQDVATVIMDQMKTQRFMFAHAGGGDFVCLVSRFDEFDPAELTMSLQSSMDEFDALYAEEGLPVPTLRVGEQIFKSMFSFGPSSDLFTRAIQSAHEKQKSSLPSWSWRATG